MTRIVHCKTWWDSCDWSYRAAESVLRELSSMARFAQLKPPGRGGKICTTVGIECGKVRPAGAIEHGKIRLSCMI